MPEKTSRLAILGIAVLALLLMVALLVQGARPRPTEATPDLGKVRTAAVQQFAAGLTQTFAATPSPTVSPTASATSNVTAAATETPACLGLHFVRDVTIPDNTEMTPAEVFTKTWQVENDGTCAWQPGFQVNLIGGVAMGGSPFKVAQTVGPGGSIQVSIKMAAPTNIKGVVQGTWKMADETGQTFGDYLSVVIVIGGQTQSPTAPAASVTPTP
jgi:Ig-like domain from next to BRCA1 gene